MTASTPSRCPTPSIRCAMPNRSRLRRGRRTRARETCSNELGSRILIRGANGDFNGRRARQAPRLSSRRSEPVAGRRLGLRLHHGGRRRSPGCNALVRARRRSCSASAPSACSTPCSGWWRTSSREATTRATTPASCSCHLRYGMILFIASEVMFFVAWFWAFFDAGAVSDRRASGRARPAVRRRAGRRRASRPSTPGTCRCSTR